jgi:hypothetical protein
MFVNNIPGYTITLLDHYDVGNSTYPMKNKGFWDMMLL